MIIACFYRFWSGLGSQVVRVRLRRYGSRAAFDRLIRERLGPQLLQEHGRLWPAVPLWLLIWGNMHGWWVIPDMIAYNTDKPEMVLRIVFAYVYMTFVAWMVYVGSLTRPPGHSRN